MDSDGQEREGAMADDALHRVEDELRGLEAVIGGAIDCQKILLAFLRSVPEVAGLTTRRIGCWGTWLLG